jgi:3-hydroxybutyryl-CoA dehydrogenase
MDIAVLGATETGRVLAGACAQEGHQVQLHAGDANAVMDCIDDIEAARGQAAADGIDGTTDLEAAVEGAGAIVETTGAKTESRREQLAELEEYAAPEALIFVADAHSVTAVTAGLRRPGRSLGISLVTPGEIGVVELVVAEQTKEPARERAADFFGGLEATVLTTRDTPGFVSTRLDLALVVEAIRLVEDGVASVSDVDSAMQLGRDHPIGPLGFADERGLETILHACEDLAHRLGGRFAPPGLLREKVEAGERGKATGTGFYRWEDGEAVEPATPDPTVRGRPAPESETGEPPGPERS